MLPKPVKIHNNLALAKYSLNISEQKLFVYAIRHLNQNDNNFIESSFKLRDFASYASLEITRLYREIDSMTDSLMKTIIKIKNKDDKWTKYNLTSKCQYNNGFVTFTFNDDMKKLLLQLQEHYFLQSPSIMNFTSRYSIRIYDLLKSTSYSNNIFEIGIEQLKEILDIEGKYKRITNLKERVIDVAVEEINEFSDLKVTYEDIYLGRSIKALKFIVTREITEKCIFGLFDNLDNYREKIGLGNEYSDSHIEKLYTAAIEKYTTYKNMDDIFKYMKICYDYTKKQKPVDEYPYYKDLLEKDYINAIVKIKTGYLED